MTKRVNAYCRVCGKHFKLALSGTEEEIINRAKSWTCADCIKDEIERETYHMERDDEEGDGDGDGK